MADSEPVASLLECVDDPDEAVGDAIAKTLCRLSTPSNVDELLLLYCSRWRSTSRIVGVIERTCGLHADVLDGRTVDAVVAAAAGGPTDAPAEGVLVALGKTHCDRAAEALAGSSTPGAFPSPWSLHALAALSSVDASRTGRHVRRLLAETLPLLPTLDDDARKSAFCRALASFAAGISDQDGEGRGEAPTAELSAVHRALTARWLDSPDPRVRSDVLRALGRTAGSISWDAFVDTSPRLVSVALSLYGRAEVDSRRVTRTLCRALSRVAGAEGPPPTLPLDSVRTALFARTLSLPDYGETERVRNHFEALRCFEVLCEIPPRGATLDFLFQKTRGGVEEDRRRSVAVLTHLLVSPAGDASRALASRLRDMTDAESSVRTRRVLLRAIAALAYRGALTVDDSPLIEFIIRNLSDDGPPSAGGPSEVERFRRDCEDSLRLLSSTVAGAGDVLGPPLLRALMAPGRGESVSVIAKCLVRLSPRSDPDPGSPSPAAVFVRCLSLLNRPTAVGSRRDLLDFLTERRSDLHGNLAVAWETDLRRASSYLDSDEFSARGWESMILELFRSAVYLADDDEWTESVCRAVLEQTAESDSVPQKGVLYGSLAVLLRDVTERETAERLTDTYLDAFAGCLKGEETYLARALAVASARHGALIVGRLDNLCKGIMNRKLSRFYKFSLVRAPKHDPAENNLKYVLTTVYGEIAREVSDVRVLEKMVETKAEGSGTCVRWIVALLLSGSSTLVLIGSALTAVCHLCDAIRSVSRGILVLNERWRLMDATLIQLSEDGFINMNLEYYPVAIRALTRLISLPERLTPELRNEVLKTVSVKIFTSVPLFESSSKDETRDTREAFDELLDAFVKQTACPSTLDDVLGILDEWSVNENGEVRAMAVRSTRSALNSFVKNVRLSFETPSGFNQSGPMMGRAIWLCTDSSAAVREAAVDCVGLLIRIIDLYEGRTVDSENHPYDLLAALRDRISSAEPRAITDVTEALGRIVSEKIQHRQSLPLIESLIGGLRIGSSSESGCGAVLKIVFETKGRHLYHDVERIMDSVFITLPALSVTGKLSLLRAVSAFTEHHPETVTDYLLSRPLPFESSVNECWSMIAQNPEMAAFTIDNFVHILTVKSLLEDSVKYDREKVASVQCLSVIYGMGELLSQPHTKKIAEEKFPELFSVLYTTLVCYIGALPPLHSAVIDKRNERHGILPNALGAKISPKGVCIDTIKALLINANCVKMIEPFILCYELDTSAFLDGLIGIVGTVVKVLCQDYPERVSKLVNSLSQYSHGSLVAQRISVVTFYGHILSHRCNDNAIILETVMSALHAGWKDSALEVRAASLFGLGNIKALGEEQLNLLMPSVLSCLHRGLDDHRGSSPWTNVPLVAMVSLTEFLESNIVVEGLMSSYTPIAQRIKTFMNTDLAVLREASIRLFGEIILHQDSSDALNEQILILLPCFLLHLADEDADVVKACKQTLKKIMPALGAPNTNNMIQNHLIDGGKLHVTDFLTDLAKYMTSELSQNVPLLIDSSTNYLNSPWDCIRSNAAYMIGSLFSNLSAIATTETAIECDKSKKSITTRLLQLLKDKNPTVRASAATALGGIFTH